MLVHHRVTPSGKFAANHLYLYLGREKRCDRKVFAPRTQRSVPGQGERTTHEVPRASLHADSTSYLYNKRINARALIGQSAIVHCASKLMEKSRVF